MRVIESLALASAAVAMTLAGSAEALNVKMYGVNYNTRKGPDWATDADRCKTAAEVQADMYSVKSISDRVRIYSLVDCDQAKLVLPAAKKAGLQVALGIWTTSSHDYLLQEKAKLAELIDSGLFDSNVVAMHVGSETIYREEITADTAISYMTEIRDYMHSRNINLNVTIADVIDIYYSNPKLIDAVDYISVNQFSFWENVDINEGAAVTLDRLAKLRTLAHEKNKEIIISETGWSSGGDDPAASDATPANQAKFFNDFYLVAQSHGFKYYWFMAFDSKWRVTNGGKEVEADFGVFQEDQNMKDNFKSLTVPTRTAQAIRNAGTDLLLSESGGNLYMAGMSSDWLLTEQRTWFFDSATSQIRSMSSDRCLDAYQAWNGGIVHVYRCMDSEPNQKWTYNSVTGQLQHATHTGFCLDTDPAQNNKLQLYGCSANNKNQQWGVTGVSDTSELAFSDGSVRFFTTESTKPFAQLVRKDSDAVTIGYGGQGVDGSEWVYDASTHLVKSKNSDYCLDAYEGWDAGRVHVWACSASEKNQMWQLDTNTNQLRHLTHSGFCLDADLSANGGAGVLQLYGCHLSNNNQVWRVVDTVARGVTLRSVSGGSTYLQPVPSSDTVVGVAENAASAQQLWFWNPNTKTFLNKYYNTCLDAYEAWEGGRVHTYACIATEANQNWSYDASAQLVRHVKHSGFCLAFNNLNDKLLQLKACNTADATQLIKVETA
jgi:glucan 1,3-beta-glucosidase